jgi:P-type Ca2+ transporter type 2C
MYEDQCFIRVLAACETMGNATNLCSDKTGTLTENRMTVVETWMGDKKYSQLEFDHPVVSTAVQELIVENACINRTAYLVTHDSNGLPLPRPNIIGNKTEGALILMSMSWGAEYEEVKSRLFHESTDRIFAFNSSKKRSTALVHRSDGSVRLYVKGAPEWLLTDCTFYLKQDGTLGNMSPGKKKEIEEHINAMANNARRTLCLAHKDFKSASLLPPNWAQCPPDNSGLCCDCIVGIIDPLRSDVNDAVARAQGAGVIVRMVTGELVHSPLSPVLS